MILNDQDYDEKNKNNQRVANFTFIRKPDRKTSFSLDS